jgi:hypothetical protein
MFPRRHMLRLFLIFILSAPFASAAGFTRGDTVRLTKGENLLVNGKNISRVTKGSEFSVLAHDAAQHQVQVAFMKDDGTWIAATLPDEVLEAATPPAWTDLLRGVESFRDQRFDERLLTRAAAASPQPDPKGPNDPSPALAAALVQRIKAVLQTAAVARAGGAPAAQALATALGNLREIAAQLDTAGHPALAAALDDGAERLAKAAALPNVPAGKLDRAAAMERAAAAEKTATLARQAIAARKLIAAQRQIDEGLKDATAHPLLRAWQARVTRDIEEAQSLHDTAQKMRRFDKGLVHALSALDDGLKICADHPALRELRHEMNEQFEERTSPRVTPAFLTAAKVKTAREALEEGRQLYTSRCSECHDLEMIDSRGRSGWEKAVGGMSRRASLTGAEQTRILDYLMAAMAAVDAQGEK